MGLWFCLGGIVARQTRNFAILIRPAYLALMRVTDPAKSLVKHITVTETRDLAMPPSCLRRNSGANHAQV